MCIVVFMSVKSRNISRINQKMIADHMEISVATVSKALSAHKDIAPETRRRVEVVANELGYRRKKSKSDQGVNAAAKGAFVGVMVRRPIDSGMEDRPSYLSSLTRAATGFNASIVLQELASTDDPYSVLDKRSMPPAIRDGVVSGILMGGGTWPAEIVNELSKRHRVIMFPQKALGSQVDVVGADYMGAMLEIVARLKGLGHERIGFFGRCGEMPDVSEIYAGYTRAIDRYELLSDPRWVVSVDREHMLTEADESYWQQKVDEAEAIKKNGQVDAWICCNDWPAYQLYRGMADRGYSIPKDLSITGFDDNEPANLGCPPVTSVQIPMDGICQTLFKRLFDSINSPLSMPIQMGVGGKIVDHGTIGPPAYLDQ